MKMPANMMMKIVRRSGEVSTLVNGNWRKIDVYYEVLIMFAAPRARKWIQMKITYKYIYGSWTHTPKKQQQLCSTQNSRPRNLFLLKRASIGDEISPSDWMHNLPRCVCVCECANAECVFASQSTLPVQWIHIESHAIANCIINIIYKVIFFFLSLIVRTFVPISFLLIHVCASAYQHISGKLIIIACKVEGIHNKTPIRNYYLRFVVIWMAFMGMPVCKKKNSDKWARSMLAERRASTDLCGWLWQIYWFHSNWNELASVRWATFPSQFTHLVDMIFSYGKIVPSIYIFEHKLGLI